MMIQQMASNCTPIVYFWAHICVCVKTLARVQYFKAEKNIIMIMQQLFGADSECEMKCVVYKLRERRLWQTLADENSNKTQHFTIYSAFGCVQ